MNSPDSRFVNLKYVINDEWIFFSNYESPRRNNFLKILIFLVYSLGRDQYTDKDKNQNKKN